MDRAGGETRHPEDVAGVNPQQPLDFGVADEGRLVVGPRRHQRSLEHDGQSGCARHQIFSGDCGLPVHADQASVAANCGDTEVIRGFPGAGGGRAPRLARAMGNGRAPHAGLRSSVGRRYGRKQRLRLFLGHGRQHGRMRSGTAAHRRRAPGSGSRAGGAPRPRRRPTPPLADRIPPPSAAGGSSASPAPARGSGVWSISSIWRSWAGAPAGALAGASASIGSSASSGGGALIAGADAGRMPVPAPARRGHGVLLRRHF